MEQDGIALEKLNTRIRRLPSGTFAYLQEPLITGNPRTYPVIMGLKDQLACRMPANLVSRVSDHFEVIGDVAVLSIPAELEPYKHLIAQAVASKRKNIATILNKKEKVTGESRTARYEVLQGDSSVTLHHEFGYAYRLDISRTFFSSRLANERKRVTDQVRQGEKVCVPFAGVGPFAIPAAARGAEVFAVEKNPEAFQYLLENIALNRVTGNCSAVQGDALDTAHLPYTVFDRLIIPAPYGLDHALETFLPVLSENGMVHFYTFKAKEQIPDLIRGFEQEGLMVRYSAPCGNVARGVSRWVFDMARTHGL
ncbi:MAG: class I SAM-dependent methyltransferase family protein [Methanoregulaceae archaeon]|nr:MAG: class I SAM-dependent methyltransferase family protein [Methanoregulaceae archaeon]